MATEGISAALEIGTNIQAQLEKAQKTIDRMALASESLAKNFSSFAGGVSQAFNSMGASGTPVVIKNIADIVNAMSNLNAKQGANAKKTLSTEQDLSDRLEKILRKRINTQSEIYNTINQLQKYQADFMTSNTAAGNSFNDKGYKESIRFVKELKDRVVELGLAYDHTKAKSLVGSARSAGKTATDYASTLEVINKANAALTELQKPGATANTKTNTRWIKEMNDLLNTSIANLENYKKALLSSKKEAGSATSELNRALKLKDKGTSDSLVNQILRIYSALEKLQTMKRSGNQFVNDKDIQKAEAELRRLGTRLGEVNQQELTLAESMRNRAAAAFAPTNNMDKMLAQYKELRILLKEMTAMNKKGSFFSPAEIKNVEAAINSLNNKMNAMRGTMTSLGKNAQLVSSLMSMAFNPFMIINFIRNLITVRGEFEMAQRSLEVIIQDTNKAKNMFTEIEQIAIKSPFSVSQILRQTKQLAAYRIEADKLVETTKMLGDISAGLGVDMNRLILAYGQVKATTWLKATELRQFSEAGVNMLGGLADRFSEIYKRAVSTSEVMQMITKRMVSFEDVDAVLRQQTSEGGTFYKMQEKQAETLRGMIVNLKDRLQIAFNEMGTSYDGLMKKIVKGVENMISNWRTLSVVLTGIASFKILSGVFSLIGTSITGLITKIRAINTILAENRTMFNMAAAAGNAYSKRIKFGMNLGGIVSKLGLGNVVAIGLSIAAIIGSIVKQAKALENEIKKISENLKNTTQSSVAKYNELLDIAIDINQTEQLRQQALDKLKKEYGGILSIQDIELSNIEEMNKAREQQVELIKQQAKEEAKTEAISSLIKVLNRTFNQRTKIMADPVYGNGYLAFIEKFKNEVKGLSLIPEDDIVAIQRVIENNIVNGTYKSADEATQEFFKMLLIRAGATEEQISKIVNADSLYFVGSVTSQFDKVIKKTEKMFGFFSDNGVDLTENINLQKYYDLIKSLEEARSEYLKSEEAFNKKEIYKVNPQQKELDVQDFIDKRKKSILDAIKGDNTIEEEFAKVLEEKLNKAYGKVSMSFLDGAIAKSMAEVNALYANELVIPMGSGDLIKSEKQDIGEYLATIKKQYEDYSNQIAKIFSENAREGQILEVAQRWAKDSYNAYLEIAKGGDAEQAKKALEDMRITAIHNLQMEQEAIDVLNDKLGEETKKALQLSAEDNKRKQRQKDIYELAKKTFELSSKTGSIEASELKKINSEIADMAAALEITPPGDYNIKHLKDWINNFINDELNPELRASLVIDVQKADENVIKELNEGVKTATYNVINLGKEWRNMSKEEQDVSKKILKESMFSELKGNINIPDSIKNIEPPEFFTPEYVAAWGDSIRAAISASGIEEDKDFWLKWELDMVRFRKQYNNENSSSAKEYKASLKEFVNEVKKAAKEFDALNDEGDKLLLERLQRSGKAIGVSLPATFTNDSINEWLKKYESKLGRDNVLDIKLAWNKEDTADTVREMSDYVSTLWDKYNNSKKMEEFGISFSGKSSLSILEEIKAMEDKMSKDTSDASQKAYEDIKKRRLEIIRSEQEEAAKLIQEGQKKALSKVEQIWTKTFKDIADIRNKANQEGVESTISESSIKSGINGKMAQAIKDVADAEWEAYKATEMYAMAFGDLEGLGVDVLERLRAQLEGFKSSGGLNPTEIKTVTNAITELTNKIEEVKGVGFGNIFLSGFKQISDAAKEFKDKIPNLTQNFIISSAAVESAQEEYNALKALAEQQPENIELATRLEIAYALLTSAQEQNALATRELNDAQKQALAKIDSAKKNLTKVENALSSVSSTVSSAISLFNDFADAFGLEVSEETNAALEGFQKGFGLVISLAALAISSMTAYKAIVDAGIVNTAILETMLWPLLAAAVALGAIIAIIQARDKKLAKMVEEHKDAVDALEKAYDKLKDSMEAALNTKLAAKYNKDMLANLKQQKKELEEAIALDEKRKQKQEVKDEIEDLKEQLEEVKQKEQEAADAWMELMGATSDWAGLSKDWASDWLDAFKSAESGIESLSESFDSLWDGIVSKQLSNSLQTYIEDIRDYLTKALNDGIITEVEAETIKRLKEQLKRANTDLTAQAAKLGITQTGNVSEDTLQRGIESVTEQTAQALESILNSTRYYVADNNRILLALEKTFTVGDDENTILSNIKSQTRYLKSIAAIADAVFVSGGHTKGGGGLKVFID